MALDRLPLRWPTPADPHLLHELLTTPPELLCRESAIITAGQQVGLPMQRIGSHPLFSGYRHYASNPHDWVLVNLADDPLYHDPDGFPIPQAVLRQLHTLAHHGVTFDTLAVAHEIPQGQLTAGQPLTAAVLCPNPAAVAHRNATWIGRFAQIGSALALAPLTAWQTLGALMQRTAATAPSRPSLALDPILLGALVAPGRPIQPGEPARWITIAAWQYE
jgi:hypothetical protein